MLEISLGCIFSVELGKKSCARGRQMAIILSVCLSVSACPVVVLSTHSLTHSLTQALFSFRQTVDNDESLSTGKTVIACQQEREMGIRGRAWRERERQFWVEKLCLLMHTSIVLRKYSSRCDTCLEFTYIDLESSNSLSQFHCKLPLTPPSLYRAARDLGCKRKSFK